MLEDADGRHIGEGLRGDEIGVGERPRVGPQEVQRPDDLVAQVHRQRINRCPARGQGLGSEPRPTVPSVREVLAVHGRAGPETVQARAVVVLDLEQLEHLHRVAGRRRHPESTRTVGEEQPGLGQAEEVHATGGQDGEEVDDVEVGHQRVGHIDERPGEERFAWCHQATSCFCELAEVQDVGRHGYYPGPGQTILNRRATTSEATSWIGRPSA